MNEYGVVTEARTIGWSVFCRDRSSAFGTT